MTTILPSGLNAAEATTLSCPRRMAISSPVGGVPDPGGILHRAQHVGIIVRSSDHGPTVGAERGELNRILVATQDGDLPPRGDIPNAGGFVVGRGDHGPAVGAIDG